MSTRFVCSMQVYFFMYWKLFVVFAYAVIDVMTFNTQ